MLSTEYTRPRPLAGKQSASSAGAMATYAASPMPTRARAAIAPRPENGRCDHVHDHERRNQPADLRVGQPHRALQLRHDGRYDVAIEVVQQVNRGQDAERTSGGARYGYD